MTEEPAWRRIIGHHGTFLASLDLWDTDRVAKPRSIQSDYRALWSLRAAIGELVILEGPVVLVDARSLKPGNSAHILIHPMQPEAWLNIDAGATLVLHGKSQRLPEIGTAVILDRHQVPASDPLHFDRIEESPSLRLLVRREKRLLPWRR